MVKLQDLKLEKAIKKLGKDIKLIFLALFNVHKETGITAIYKYKRYSKSDLLVDASSYILTKFPSMNQEEFNKLWNKFAKIFEKRANYDILLGFQSQDIQNSIIIEYKQEIINEISRCINALTDLEKKGISLFLKIKLNLKHQKIINSSMNQFNEQFNLIFREPFALENNTTIYDLAIKVGLLYKSTWKTTNKGIEDHGIAFKLPLYLDEILIGEITKALLTDIEIPSFFNELDNFIDINDNEQKKEFKKIIDKQYSRGDFVEFS